MVVVNKGRGGKDFQISAMIKCYCENGSRLSRLQTAELTTACTGLYMEENNRNYLMEKREGRQ